MFTNNVKKYLSEDDLTIGNLETVMGGDSVQYRGYPLFNTPDEYLTDIKKCRLRFY